MANSTFGTVADTIYTDLDHEIKSTRRMLERYPEGHDDWRPHAKSMSLSKLASHTAELPQFATTMVTTDSMDFMKGEYVSHSCNSKAELLELFDSSTDALRAALSAADSAALDRTWTLRKGEDVVLSGRKRDLIRGMALNHMVHHRAQLGVYYRMLDVPVPGLYGPSADEPN
ncbi:MAG: DinB family protein [Gemmatimonadaceae bacterium]